MTKPKKDPYSIKGLQDVYLQSVNEFRDQLDKCFQEKHKGFSHDVFGSDIRFRSRICYVCKSRYVLIELWPAKKKRKKKK